MEHKIGTQIARLRKEQEITQTALAEYLSVSPQAVGKRRQHPRYLSASADCGIFRREH